MAAAAQSECLPVPIQFSAPFSVRFGSVGHCSIDSGRQEKKKEKKKMRPLTKGGKDGRQRCTELSARQRPITALLQREGKDAFKN